MGLLLVFIKLELMAIAMAKTTLKKPLHQEEAEVH